MALGRTRTRLVGFLCGSLGLDSALLVEGSLECSAVGGGGLSFATPRGHDAVKQRTDRPVGHDARLATPIPDEGALGAGRVDLIDVRGRQAVPGGRDQILEDPRRTHDRGGRRVGERHADNLDPEQRRVRIFVGR